MTLEERILESLVQDGRNLEQIFEYLLYYHERFIKSDIILIIRRLFDKGWIKIEYPNSLKDDTIIREKYLYDYWFGLTMDGESECIKRNIMISSS